MKNIEDESQSPVAATNFTTRTAATAIAQAAADAWLFACRKKGGRRIAARTEKLREKFKLWFLGFGLPLSMDSRDIIPAAQSFAERMTKEGGAAFVHVVHHNGHPDQLCGFALSNKSIEPERRRFARAIGARLRDLRVHCPKAGANVSLRLASEIMPALSTNPAHPPMTIAVGRLQDLYDEVAMSLAELTTTRTASSGIDFTPPKKLGMSSSANNSMESKAANGRRCIDCGKPISERGNRAVYCKWHGTKASRRRFRKQEAQAHAERASNGSGPIAPAQPVGRPLASAEEKASNEARPAASRSRRYPNRANR